MRVPITATAFIVLSGFILIDFCVRRALDGALLGFLALLVLGIMLWCANKKVICKECNHKFITPDAISLKAECPKCHRKLKGATQDMVGEIGVCPKCKAEFEIKK